MTTAAEIAAALVLARHVLRLRSAILRELAAGVAVQEAAAEAERAQVRRERVA